MFRSKLVTGFLVAVLALTASAASGATAPDVAPRSRLDNQTCLSCHDGAKGPIEVPGADGETRPLRAVEHQGFATSVHSDMQCVSCHVEITDSVANHKKTSGARPPDCVQCHSKLQQAATR